MIFSLLCGCSDSSVDSSNNNQTKEVTGPHITVLKLLNAEGFADIEECKKYIDPKTVYKEFNKIDYQVPAENYGIDTAGKTSGELTWEWHLKYYFEKGIRDSNLTSHKDFFNYKIEESVRGEVAVVELIPLIKNRRKMWFRLILTDGNWIIESRKLKD